MAVMPMSTINVFGLQKDRKRILEAIQCVGVIEVRPFKKKYGNLEKMDTLKSRSKFQKAKNDCEHALVVLDEYSTEDKSLFDSFKGKSLIDNEEYSGLVQKRDVMFESVTNILRYEKEIETEKARIIKMTNDIESLMPWQNLPIPLSFSGTKKTTAFIGTFPEVCTEESLKAQFTDVCKNKKAAELEYAIHFEILESGETQTYVVVVSPKAVDKEVEEVLRHMGFSAPAVTCDDIPKRQIEACKEAIKDAQYKIKEAEDIIRDASKKRDEIKFLVDYYAMRIDKYQVLEKLGQSKRTFALTGYVPTEKAQTVEKVLSEKWGAAAESYPAEGDDVPVLLKNNGFAAPLEGVLETFSLPGKGEVDPTAVMAVFYYFLFGLMLSDAAYGILMVLICGIGLWKFPKMEDGLRKSLKMFLYCGISTTFWGIMFGGYFGDAIQVIAKTFFNKDIIIKPLWFTPMDNPMRMLVFSLLIGIIHIFAGLGMKLYSLARTGAWRDVIYDVVFWYMLVGGAIVYLLSIQMFVDMTNLSFILPASVGKAAAIVAILGAIGITLTAGRSSKNPFKRLAKGLYELYNVTGYLSDILSYSRLLALGLATGVIANVFNKMGSMFGGGVLGAIAFAIVFVIGHTLNIGINLLGAYVHTNRLQFVEFFGKFYDGGGEKYTPFKAETGYYEIKNE